MLRQRVARRALDVNRSAYYESLKARARALRAEYGFSSPRVTRSELRQIYRAEEIQIDLWTPKLRNLRGAYFCGSDGCGPSVLVARGLPEEPRVFTMAHELKHHFFDRAIALSFCDASNVDSRIEIGAEIFAAEMIFPEENFREVADGAGFVKGRVAPEDVVRLKRETRTTLSYQAIVKRLDFLGYADPVTFKRVKWKKLEEEVFGEPLYKRLLRRRRSTR
jgi:Zn-dependent peptidase ImmA (M78 family)